MVNQLKAFCEEKKWGLKDKYCLLAVSGGVDSMVLSHLFQKAGWRFAVAHCNFTLRGEDSDKDEDFVRGWADANEASCYSVRFDTQKQAAEAGLSIQEIARSLRYHWLESLRQELRCDYIATAHHLNDSVETILFHLARGTGIDGLTGIPVQNGRVIRPLLFTTKELILEYAASEKIPFRTDLSNERDYYTRNRIRQQIVPAMEVINPAFISSMESTIDRLRQTRLLAAERIKSLSSRWLKKDGPVWQLQTPEWEQHPARAALLWEIIRPLGFSSRQTNQIIEAKDHTGALFFSSTHRLLVDRELFIISPIPDTENPEIFEIYRGVRAVIAGDQELTLECDLPVPDQFPPDTREAWLDQDKLQFPLRLRKWKPGDAFQPLGMEGKTQKLQDFFVNQKLSRLEKENTWILLSGGDICWVVGHRIDQRYKVTPDTSSCLHLQVRY